MSKPFRRKGDVVVVGLSASERTAIEGIPAVIEAAGDADGRFAYRAHVDDADAEGRYQDLIGDDLDRLRAGDRAMFLDTIAAGSLTIEQAEAVMRVVGEARIVLASRLGIEEDGWEEEAPISDPEVKKGLTSTFPVPTMPESCRFWMSQ